MINLVLFYNIKVIILNQCKNLILFKFLTSIFLTTKLIISYKAGFKNDNRKKDSLNKNLNNLKILVLIIFKENKINNDNY